MTPSQRFAPYALVALALLKLPARFPRGQDYQDLGSFLASGDLYNRGFNPYDVPTPAGFTISGINFNPPVLLGVFGLLARLPRESVHIWAFVGQLAIAIGMFEWVRRRYATPPWKIAFLLAAEPLWYALWVGNFYPVLALLVLAIRECRDRPRISGALIGVLCAVKPNLLLWPLLLLIAGEITSALAAFTVAGGMSLAAGFLYGFGRYADWLHAIGAWRWKVDAVTDLSLQGAARFAGYPLLAFLPALAVVVASVWAARRVVPSRLGEVAILAALLLSPVAWVGYLLAVYPYLADRPWRAPTFVAFVLLLPPCLMQNPLSNTVFPPAGLYTLAAVLFLVDALRTGREVATA